MSASPPSEAASDPTTSVAQRLEERAKEIFTQADVDGSGWLSHSELKRLIHANKELREELHAYGWKKFFDELDANHDGRIELAELVLYIQTHANALNSAKSSVAEPFPSLGAVAEHVAESSEAFTAPRTVSGLVAESAPVLYQFSPGWGMPSVDPECVAVQALLRFGDVEHHVVNCNNESMSPSGVLPEVPVPCDHCSLGRGCCLSREISARPLFSILPLPLTLCSTGVFYHSSFHTLISATLQAHFLFSVAPTVH